MFYSAVRVCYVFMISTRHFGNASLCNGYSNTGLVCLRIGLHWSFLLFFLICLGVLLLFGVRTYVFIITTSVGITCGFREIIISVHLYRPVCMGIYVYLANGD